MDSQKEQAQVKKQITEKRAQLKSLQQKCQLQNKKIKLYRKQNEQLRHASTRQINIDTTLLLNSKELTDANSRLQSAIEDLSQQLEISLDSYNADQVEDSKGVVKEVNVLALRHLTVTQETEQIDLGGQELTDEDIMGLQGFRNMNALIIGDNLVGDEGVKAICKMEGLVKLQLNANKFKADSLKNMYKLKNLKILDIRNNNLGNTVFPHLAMLTNLTELSISKNKLTSQNFPQLSTLHNLTYLDLTNNEFTDDIIQTIINSMKKLLHLYLMSNGLTFGGVMELMGGLGKLEVLDVRFNITEEAQKGVVKGIKGEKLQLFV